MVVMASQLEERGCTVLNSHASSFLRTLDGVDVCGDRLAEAINSFVQARARRGLCLTEISFVGYSFGGGS